MKSAPPIAVVDHLGGLDRGLADVAGDELGAVALDEVALREHADRAVDAGDEARDGRLAGSRDCRRTRGAASCPGSSSPPRPRSPWMRSTWVWWRISVFTASSPTSASSSASSSSSVFGGGLRAASAGLLRRGRGRRPLGRPRGVGRATPGAACRARTGRGSGGACRSRASCALPEHGRGARAPRSSARRATPAAIASSASAARVRRRGLGIGARAAGASTGVGSRGERLAGLRPRRANPAGTRRTRRPTRARRPASCGSRPRRPPRPRACARRVAVRRVAPSSASSASCRSSGVPTSACHRFSGSSASAPEPNFSARKRPCAISASASARHAASKTSSIFEPSRSSWSHRTVERRLAAGHRAPVGEVARQAEVRGDGLGEVARRGAHHRVRLRAARARAGRGAGSSGARWPRCARSGPRRWPGTWPSVAARSASSAASVAASGSTGRGRGRAPCAGGTRAPRGDRRRTPGAASDDADGRRDRAEHAERGDTDRGGADRDDRAGRDLRAEPLRTSGRHRRCARRARRGHGRGHAVGGSPRFSTSCRSRCRGPRTARTRVEVRLRLVDLGLRAT